MTELKPCPFCGDTYILIRKTKDYKYTIGCNTLNCICLHTKGLVYKTEEQATKTWNRRVNDI